MSNRSHLTRNCVEFLQEDILVEIHFHLKIIFLPNISFRVLREYLVQNGVPCTRHPTTNTLSFGATNNSLDDEENIYAFDQLDPFRNGSGKSRTEQEEKYQAPPSPPIIVTQSSNHEDKDRKQHIVWCSILKIILTVSMAD